MPSKRFRIVGSVIDEKTGRPIAGMRVEAWDKDHVLQKAVGQAVSDEAGRFIVEFGKEALQKRQPELYFKLYLENRLVATTEESVVWNVRRGARRIVIRLPGTERAAAPPAKYAVEGEVRTPDGTVWVGAAIKAFHKHLKGEQPLGEGQTTTEGRYHITYALPETVIRGPNLLVRAYDGGGRVAASSTVLFDAPPQATVNLRAGGEEYQGASDFEKRTADLAPHLKGMALDELNTEQVAFLKAETRVDPAEVDYQVAAARTAKATNLPSEVLYGLFRAGLPTDLDALLAQPPEAQREALAAALVRNIIPARFKNGSESILLSLQRLVLERAFASKDGGTNPLVALLGTVLPDRSRQEALVRLYVEHQGSTPDFWSDLRNNPVFKEQADEINWTVQLGALTRNHLPLIKELQKRHEGGEIQSLRDLAAYDEDSWLALIRPVGVPAGIPGKDVEEKRVRYAHAIALALEDAFPTAAVFGRVVKGSFPHAGELKAFYAQNPEFRLEAEPVDRYLARNPGALDGIQDKASVTEALKAMQRVSRFAPRSVQMGRLMADNVHSAHAAARLGRSRFVKAYGPQMGSSEAKKAWEKASLIAGAAMNLVMDVAAVVPGGHDGAQTRDADRRRSPGLGEALRLSRSV